MESVSFVKEKLAKWRNGSDEMNNHDAWEDAAVGIFTAASEIAAAAGIELTTPRIVGRQTARNNIPASNPSDYYRRAIWYPYLDSTIMSMNEKFSTHHLTVLKLAALVPAVIEQYDCHDVADAFRFYSSGQFNLAS